MKKKTSKNFNQIVRAHVLGIYVIGIFLGSVTLEPFVRPVYAAAPIATRVDMEDIDSDIVAMQVKDIPNSGCSYGTTCNHYRFVSSDSEDADSADLSMVTYNGFNPVSGHVYPGDVTEFRFNVSDIGTSPSGGDFVVAAGTIKDPGDIANGTITITDANIRDYASPTLSVSDLPSSTNDQTPSFTLNSSEAANVTYGGGCNGTPSSISAGDNTLTLDSDGAGADLPEGTYSGCTVTVADLSIVTTNTVNNFPIGSFIIDITSPTVVSATTGDNDSDGQIDRLTVVYSEAVDDADYNAVEVDGYSINGLEDPSFSYPSATFCQDGANPTPTVTGLPGGVFSSAPTGLILNPSTGFINLSTSTLGVYTLSYETNGISPSTRSISMTVLSSSPDATFSYSGSPFSQNGSNPSPVFDPGASAGFFSAPAGIEFVNENTGEINLLESEPGTYLITNTIPVSGSCGASVQTYSVTINPSGGTNTRIYNLEESGTPDTGATPALTWTGGNAADLAGNSLNTTGAPASAADGAAPVILDRAYAFRNAANSANTIQYTFSENTLWNTGSTSQFAVSNNDLTGFDDDGEPYAFVSGSGTTILQLATYGTTDLTGTNGGTEPTVSYTQSVTTADRLQDTAGNYVVSEGPMSLTDRQGPTTVGSRTYTDNGDDGSVDRITLNFTENVYWTGDDFDEWSISNNDLTDFATDSNTVDIGYTRINGYINLFGTTVITLTTSGTTNLTGVGAGTQATFGYHQSADPAKRVKDAAGNDMYDETSTWSTMADGAAPILSEISPVTTPAGNRNPSYSFGSTEEGAVTAYGGGCQSITTTAVVGTNTIVLDSDGASAPLDYGTYNCTVTVADTATNASTPLAMTSFTIIDDANASLTLGTNATVGGVDNSTLTLTVPVNLDNSSSIEFDVPDNLDVSGVALSSTTFGGNGFYGCSVTGQHVTCTVYTDLTAGTGDIVLSGITAKYAATGQTLSNVIVYSSILNGNVATDASGTVTNTVAADASGSMVLSSPTVGAVGDTTLTLTAPFALDADDLIAINFPSYMDISGVNSAVTGTFENGNEITCTPSGQNLYCTVVSGPTLATGTIIMTGITSRYAGSTDIVALEVKDEGISGPYIAVDTDVPLTDVSTYDATASVVLASPTVGATGDTTLTLSVPFALGQDDTIDITFPAYMNVSGVASAVTGTFESSNEITCAATGQTVTCTVISGPTLTTGTIIMTGITSYYAGTADITSLEVEDDGFASRDIAADTAVALTNVTPADASASVVLASPAVGATGDTTLTLSVPFALDADDRIDITFPSYMSINGIINSVTGTFENGGEITCSNSGPVLNCAVISGTTLTTGTIIMSGITSYYAGTADITSLKVEDEGLANDIATDSSVALTDVAPGTLTATNVEPASLVVSASGLVTVSFTTVTTLPDDGKVVVTFPAGFDVTGVTATSGLTNIDGTLSIGISGQEVTLSRNSDGTNVPGGTAVSITLGSVMNPGTLGLTGTYSIQTETTADDLIDEDLAVTGDTIVAAPAVTPPVVAGGGGGAGGSNKNSSSTSDSTTSSKAIIISGPATGKQSYSGPIQLPSASLKSNSDGTRSGVLTKEGTITIKPNSKSKISVAIPSNTTVTGNSKWDGKIQPPLIQSVTKIKSTDPKVAKKVVAAVIKVGSLSSPLTFSNPVTLSIPVNLPEGTPVTILFSGDANSWESYATGIVVNGQVVFQTNHMSYYAITAAEEAIAAGVSGFADTVGHWAEAYIAKLTSMAVVSGKSSTAFAPDESITRAELSKIAVNAFGLDLPEAVAEAPFNDVLVDSWFAPYVLAAKEAGFIEGYENGKVFSPNASINRAEAIKILLEAAGFTDIDSNFGEKYSSHAEYTYAGLKDVPIGTWFAKYVAYGYDKGIISGYGDGTFRPGNSITRAEVAKIVVKILEMQK